MQEDKLLDKEIMRTLRVLELKGLVVSVLGPDGQVGWRQTEKGKRMRPDEIDIDIPRLS